MNTRNQIQIQTHRFGVRKVVDADGSEHAALPQLWVVRNERHGLHVAVVHSERPLSHDLVVDVALPREVLAREELRRFSRVAILKVQWDEGRGRRGKVLYLDTRSRQENIVKTTILIVANSCPL